jgi:hypothetical protein
MSTVWLKSRSNVATTAAMSSPKISLHALNGVNQ